MTLTAAPDTRPAPVEPTTPIRPSEAIRLGCLIAPVQAFGRFFPGPGEACALGAMALGFGHDKRGTEDEMWAFVDRRLPELMTFLSRTTRTSILISELNDDLEWSRERIADWLEGLGL